MEKMTLASRKKTKPRSRERRPSREIQIEEWVIGPIPDDFELSPEEEKEFEASGPHVYDKAKWHYQGEYPKDLPEKQAFVHTGMFVGWLIGHEMIGEEFLLGMKCLPVINRFKRRQITGAQVYKLLGGCLTSDQLTVVGNKFARFYYDGKFGDDYQESLVQDLPSFYHVKDTWQNYDAIKSRIDERYAAWRRKRASKKRKRS